MPEVDRKTQELLKLYQRCQQRGCLPDDGGVLDQSEYIMQMFDIVDDRIAEHKKREKENIDRERALDEARRQMP